MNGTERVFETVERRAGKLREGEGKRKSNGQEEERKSRGKRLKSNKKISLVIGFDGIS